MLWHSRFCNWQLCILFLYFIVTSDSILNEFLGNIGTALLLGMFSALQVSIIVIVPSLFLRALSSPFNVLKYLPALLFFGVTWFSIIQAQIGSKEFWWFPNLALPVGILYFVIFLRWADKVLSLPD